jgi:hypothetical protein
MQSGERKPKPHNGNARGKIIPITGKAGVHSGGGQDRLASSHGRRADPSDDLTSLEKMTPQQLVEAATYNPHPEVRKKALGKISQDKFALQSVIMTTPYPDTEADATSCLKALSASESSDVKTK